MSKKMLIDATHPEETRVVVVNGARIEEFDAEAASKKQLKGNIYLAKITRVEPSLQAAFVEYGGNRHGFLAFGEIHPDYYRIPIADRQALIEEEQEPEEQGDLDAGDGSLEELGGDETGQETAEPIARRPRLKRGYKIQEVIKNNQLILVQVVKEERGAKGAALTSYISLAGRYCVLMPNSIRGGGVSRKISNIADRKRMKTLIAELELPEGMGVILRTAGAGRSKAEVKRDFGYLVKQWEKIRSKTLESSAPELIHEEGDLIKRSLRDLYNKDMEEILVAGDEAYRVAKSLMKELIPSHARKVLRFDPQEKGVSLFRSYKVEDQLAAIHAPSVRLPSGGSLVMHQTEALVAIDVNSGKAIRERHIEETATKTNLEAADEIARQLRLRDLAGLIVIDFIDMEESKNNQAVERRLKEALRMDRARIQIGRISPFGLLEMSRQRLRPSLLESTTRSCPHCGGAGYVPSVEAAALNGYRKLEEEVRRGGTEVVVYADQETAFYLLNNKRQSLSEMERQYGVTIAVQVRGDLSPGEVQIVRDGATPAPVKAEPRTVKTEETNGKKRRPVAENRAVAEPQNTAAAADTDGAEDGEEETPRKRRRPRRRGGRRRNKNNGVLSSQETVENNSAEAVENTIADVEADSAEAQIISAEGVLPGADGASPDGEGEKRKPARRRVRRTKKAEEALNAQAGEETAAPTANEEQPEQTEAAIPVTPDAPESVEEKPKRRRSRARKRPAETASDASNGAQAAVEAALPAAPTATTGEILRPVAASQPAAAGGSVELQQPVPPREDKPKRRGWWNRNV